MKILWLCHFSNPQVRERLHFSNDIFEATIRWLLHKQKIKRTDFAVWISNGIAEFKKFKDIELHIISPHSGMKYKTEEFEINGIHYHFFKPDDNSFIKRTRKSLRNKPNSEYKGNRKIVKKLTNQINPDLIHIYGAENPYYSITALDIDKKKYPFIISLQTLMSDIDFKTKYSTSSASYNFRTEVEQKVLQRATYIGSTIEKYRELVWLNINQKAIFMNTTLAVAENIEINKSKKIYDFVYFAAQIEKAADVAIEAFALVCQKYRSLTLNIIGGGSDVFKKHLCNRISKLGIEKNVIFSGQLLTHKDVLRQIQKSKYALLPLKIDIIPGTIREAMFSGIPVVTTITPGTPTLNEKRESVLISEQGDYQAMAQNMIKLIESPELAQRLRDNGLITVNERWNNSKSMLRLVKAYQAIIDHHRNGKLISAEIGTINPQINDIQ